MISGDEEPPTIKVSLCYELSLFTKFNYFYRGKVIFIGQTPKKSNSQHNQKTIFYNIIEVNRAEQKI